MSSCNQSTGAEPDEEYDENDPPTVTTIEQVSFLHVVMICVQGARS